MSRFDNIYPFRAFCRFLVDDTRGKDFEQVFFFLLSAEAIEELKAHSKVFPVWYFSIHDIDWSGFDHGEEMSAIYQWINSHLILARLAEGRKSWEGQGLTWVGSLKEELYFFAFGLAPVKVFDFVVPPRKEYGVMELLRLVGDGEIDFYGHVVTEEEE